MTVNPCAMGDHYPRNHFFLFLKTYIRVAEVSNKRETFIVPLCLKVSHLEALQFSFKNDVAR